MKFVCGEVLRMVRKCTFQKFFGNCYLTNAAVFHSFEHRFIKLEFDAEANCGNGFVIASKIKFLWTFSRFCASRKMWSELRKL